jgi:hypothetical protein
MNETIREQVTTRKERISPLAARHFFLFFFFFFSFSLVYDLFALLIHLPVLSLIAWSSSLCSVVAASDYL